MVPLSALTIERVGTTVGAEVHGIDRSQLVDDDALPARCMDALGEHGVLVFRGLHIDDESQVAFSKRLDDVGKSEPAEVPRIFTVTLDPAKNPAADYLRGTFAWHIDGAQDEVPTKATMLSAKVVATEGGETEFASTYAAYDQLDDEEKERFGRVRVLHSFEASQRLVHPDPTPEELAALAREDGPRAPAGLAPPLGTLLPRHRRHGRPRGRVGPPGREGPARQPAGEGDGARPRLPAHVVRG